MKGEDPKDSVQERTRAGTEYTGEPGESDGEVSPAVDLARRVAAVGRETQSVLARMAEDIEKLALRWEEAEQNSALWEDRARSLKKELEETKVRLRRTEELLSRGTPEPVAEAPSPYASGAQESVRQEEPPDIKVDFQEGMTPEHAAAAQTIFNAGRYVNRMASISKSLGNPTVTLAPVAGSSTKLLLVIVWDIVWYKFLLDTSEEAREEERLTLFAEGTEPEDLAPALLTANANLDNEGRLDASEVEFSLLQGQAETFDEPAEKEIEDATEELWEQKGAPEFRWGD